MSLYAITYDLNRPGQKYDLLYQAIKSHGTYWHFMQNAWLIRTPKTAVQVRDHLQQYCDGNDKLFVARVTESAWCGLTEDGNQWIKTNVEAA